jgi:hypothetical protein
LRELEESNDLVIRQPAKCLAWRDQLGAVGLFFLFFTRTFLQQLILWTNTRRIKAGLDRISKQEMLRSVGIEIYMSVVKLPNIADYWNQKLLGRNGRASTCMSRNRFKVIRPTIAFHPDAHYENRKEDPLWHSRAMMGHFIKAATTVATPKGCFAFDESSLRCRARTKAKSYSPHKKDKFAIRLYTLVCSKFAYIYSFWDGAHGKRFENAPGAEGFCNMFKTMRSYYERAYPQSALMEEDLLLSLWVMMMAQPVRLDKSQSNKRMYYTDSYYTRHA